MNASSPNDVKNGFELCDEALAMLRGDARISAVYLHGSQARGEARTVLRGFRINRGGTV